MLAEFSKDVLKQSYLTKRLNQISHFYCIIKHHVPNPYSTLALSWKAHFKILNANVFTAGTFLPIYLKRLFLGLTNNVNVALLTFNDHIDLEGEFKGWDCSEWNISLFFFYINVTWLASFIAFFPFETTLTPPLFPSNIV